MGRAAPQLKRRCTGFPAQTPGEAPRGVPEQVPTRQSGRLSFLRAASPVPSTPENIYERKVTLLSHRVHLGDSGLPLHRQNGRPALHRREWKLAHWSPGG